MYTQTTVRSTLSNGGVDIVIWSNKELVRGIEFCRSFKGNISVASVTAHRRWVQTIVANSRQWAESQKGPQTKPTEVRKLRRRLLLSADHSLARALPLSAEQKNNAATGLAGKTEGQPAAQDRVAGQALKQRNQWCFCFCLRRPCAACHFDCPQTKK